MGPSHFGAEITPDPLVDFFLRVNGGALVLDPTAPGASEPKQKDSAQVKFGGGNPWVEIGTWQRTIP